MPFVLKLDGHPIVAESPKLLLELVVELPAPFAAEKFDNGMAAIQELSPVSPLRVLRICGRNALGITSAPQIFGDLYFSRCLLRFGEWWDCWVCGDNYLKWIGPEVMGIGRPDH